MIFLSTIICNFTQYCSFTLNLTLHLSHHLPSYHCLHYYSINFLHHSLALNSIVVIAILQVIALTIQQEALIIAIIKLVVVAIVVTVVIRKQLIIKQLLVLHHRKHFLIGNWQLTPHFYHKPNKPQLLYALETLMITIYLLHPFLPKSLLFLLVDYDLQHQLQHLPQLLLLLIQHPYLLQELSS